MAGQKSYTGWSDEQFEIINNDFIIDGYDFLGWNTKKDGSGTMYSPNTKHYFQTDTTLYAQWKLMYKYMQLVEIGDVITSSNIATKFNLNSGFRTPDLFTWTTNNAFELVFKMTTGSDVNTKQILYRMGGTYKNNLCLYNAKLFVELNNAESTVAFSPNTTYYIKVQKNGSSLIIQKSIDNNTFDTILTTTTTFNSNVEYFVFGQNYQYTDSTTTTYTENETRKKTTYVDGGYRWVTKSGCAYADKNGRTYTYALKLQHATTKKSGDKIWIANSSCAYYNNPDDWHLHEGRSSCGKYIYPNINKSTGCGYWEKYQIPQTTTYVVPVQKTRTDYFTVAVANFQGLIDFNESYFVLNGLKYKLKV